MSSPLTLTAALGTSAPVLPLKDGSVTIPGVEFRHSDLTQHVDIWRRMSRTVEFDVSLMSVVSYLCAVEYGVDFTCLPICLSAGFHHSDFLCNVNAGISEPRDLEGKRVGTRTWTVTPGLLDRGILLDEFGVDWRSITWVLAEEEHVPQAQTRLPRNVVPGKGEDLFPRLVSGDLDAGIAGVNLRRQKDPNVRPLFPNARDLDKAYYQRTGIIQPFIILAVRNAVIEENPWVLEALYHGFRAAKTRANVETEPELQEVIGDADPLPFGREANRKGLEEAIRLAREFEIISKPMTVDDIFPDLN